VHEFPDVIDVPSKQLGDGAFVIFDGELHALALHVHDGIDPNKHVTDVTFVEYPSLHCVVQNDPDSINVPSKQLGDRPFDIEGALHDIDFRVHVHDDINPAEHVTDSTLAVYPPLH